MENLILEKNELLPGVNFDAAENLMRIEGRCIPENAFLFFTPLITWIENYIEQNNNVKQAGYSLIINCDYFNSASAKMFILLFDKIALFQKSGKRFEITWQCNVDDTDLIELIRDFEAISGADIKVELTT